ncbi:CPBP family intramembrane glutamic endopeptidase [Schinkia azotoformans]|uniref:CPBP family intramembrane glutamic endopeptidase n=1 Tax=Schinkia azotoformans TaxID=1454 RepID=UPI002DBCE1CA|nr:CPBP family intramembrane glutamic endopeptidase [Schinkia azotoformans]MEC1718115.1 CPBP family intramembrane metalloprotease [Schinkia azotoformans]MEC1743690.1 CPBP family intramembrane metalloprotease [Schinkia azotoformans]MEC1748091.1 CPBP family intramembrane metalloprotease [Schinkia azotoformans]MEC1760621.1 CPBP family intramembrane metalloprotease [Schinkia azotoformans]MEC1769067.1 CPBP family intramembrane metalloprotease [Schinkia azotoformans]
MKSRYLLTILMYIFVQFSGILFGVDLLLRNGISKDDAVAIWTVISFSGGLLVVILLLLPDIKARHNTNNRVSRTRAAGWAISGIFLAFLAQVIAAQIEMMLGIKMGSENTEILVEIAMQTPIFIIVTSVVGPIFEEIIFRQIIFGSLYTRFNFWIAAITSSLIFAAVHFDFTHIIIYTAMGLVFSFLYVKTKRILVPIVAHVSMNTFVVLVRILFADDMEKLQEQYEQVQSFVGGFLQ